MGRSFCRVGSVAGLRTVVEGGLFDFGRLIFVGCLTTCLLRGFVNVVGRLVLVGRAIIRSVSFVPPLTGRLSLESSIAFSRFFIRLAIGLSLRSSSRFTLRSGRAYT